MPCSRGDSLLDSRRRTYLTTRLGQIPPAPSTSRHAHGNCQSIEHRSRHSQLVKADRNKSCNSQDSPSRSGSGQRIGPWNRRSFSTVCSTVSARNACSLAALERLLGETKEQRFLAKVCYSVGFEVGRVD